MPKIHFVADKHPCEHCQREGKNRPRAVFVVETVGFDVQMGSSMSPGYRRTWREEIAVCAKHLPGLLREIGDNLAHIYADRAFMDDPSVVNCTGPDDLSPLDLPGRGYQPLAAESAAT